MVVYLGIQTVLEGVGAVEETYSWVQAYIDSACPAITPSVPSPIPAILLLPLSTLTPTLYPHSHSPYTLPTPLSCAVGTSRSGEEMAAIKGELTSAAAARCSIQPVLQAMPSRAMSRSRPSSTAASGKPCDSWCCPMLGLMVP